ncbi:hypothetical protein [Acidithiobacillus sulfuriphilus]|uniref:hypothetical protein n=1 Tax=Acidithiobacillus sulfuriphilus TaxID=1867749 RepID=UPI003F5D785E
MMNWLSRFAGHADSSTTINVTDRKIEILCSARANLALAKRECPLVAEVELAFACIARKQVRFHDAPMGGDVIGVNERLGLLITAIVPHTCETGKAKTATEITAKKFMPKRVRIDYLHGAWVGEYDL